ncbi:MAG: hypothetical protein ABI721_04220 [Candidatus Dojkabacteria bacterium]
MSRIDHDVPISEDQLNFLEVLTDDVLKALTITDFQYSLKELFEELEKVFIDENQNDSYRFAPNLEKLVRTTLEQISNSPQLDSPGYFDVFEEFIISPEYFNIILLSFDRSLLHDPGVLGVSYEVYQKLLPKRNISEVIETNRRNLEEFLNSKAKDNSDFTLEDLNEISTILQRNLFPSQYQGIRETEGSVELIARTSVKTEINNLEQNLRSWLKAYNQLIGSSEIKTIELIKLSLLLVEIVSPRLHPFYDMNGTIAMYLGLYYSAKKYGEEIKFEPDNFIMIGKKVLQGNKIALGFFSLSLLRNNLINTESSQYFLRKYFKLNQTASNTINSFLNSLRKKSRN